MSDVLFVAIMIAFFGLCVLLVRVCDRMIGSGEITLVDAGAEPAAEAQPSAGFAQDAVEDDEPTPGNEWPPVREPRPITYEDRRAAVEAAQYGGSPSAPPPPESAPGDGAQPGDGRQRRRRSRRGGRGRRRHAAL